MAAFTLVLNVGEALLTNKCIGDYVCLYQNVLSVFVVDKLTDIYIEILLREAGMPVRFGCNDKAFLALSMFSILPLDISSLLELF